MIPQRMRLNLDAATELEALEMVQTAVALSGRLVELCPEAPISVLEVLLVTLSHGHCVKIRVLGDGVSFETEVVRGREVT